MYNPTSSGMSRIKKRTRSQEDQGDSERIQVSKKPLLKVEQRIVRGDGLRWQKVELPDRFEDAEGFYDLEEIEDVKVVRTEKNHVMFRANEGAQTDVARQEAAEEDEWDGFQDDREDTAPSKSESSSIKKSKNTKPASKGILKPSFTESAAETLEHTGGTSSFDLLTNVVEFDDLNMAEWEELSLSLDMLRALSYLKFSHPTAIQKSAIPPIVSGEDVIGKAVTGSGKTLAFGIPILERWLSLSNQSAPIALVLAPTRELAHQLHDHLAKLAEGLDKHPRIVKVTGGLSILKQQRQLELADIVVATPGRLWEVINESHGLIDRLKQIKYLVVDEADRLLSEGHFKEVEDILETLDRQLLNDDERTDTKKTDRQILVFSATFHKSLHQKLAGKLKSASNLLSNQQSMAYLLQKLPFKSKPSFIDCSPISQLSKHITESILECGAMEKDLYLYGVLLQYSSLKTLVFTNSISSVKRLTPLLQLLDRSAVALHSSMPQKSRLRSVEKFTASSSDVNNILIATDVAARGLDIKGIDLVLHYHVPRSADMYVHRSGRTARAEASGRSIMLCSPDEVVPTARLIAKIHGTDGSPPDTIQIDGDIIRRIQARVDLAQRIVEAEQAKEVTNSKDSWLRTAAEELGVDYDSDEFDDETRKNHRGRGGGKEKAKKESAQTAGDKVRMWREELKVLLSKKINLGVSERYLAGGKVDVDALLGGGASGLFLEGRN